jgi:hypothetical protein
MRSLTSLPVANICDGGGDEGPHPGAERADPESCRPQVSRSITDGGQWPFTIIELPISSPETAGAGSADTGDHVGNGHGRYRFCFMSLYTDIPRSRVAPRSRSGIHYSSVPFSETVRSCMFYSMIAWSCRRKYEPTSSPCYERTRPRQV